MEKISLIDSEGIGRAAKDMISEHGRQAFGKATERAEALRAEGFSSLAHTWDLISKAIEDRQRKPKAYLSVLKSNITLSE